MSLVGVYAAASLGMDGVGVYCNWEMLGRPFTATCTTTFLGKGPSLPQGSWWCVLRVRSSCLSTEGSGLVYQLENLWVQLASQSFLVGHPSCTVSHSSTLLFCSLFPPLFHELIPYIVYVLFPQPIHLPPSCSPLSPVSFFVPHTSDSSFPFFFCPFAPFRLSS